MFRNPDTPATNKGEVIFVDALLSIYQAIKVAGASHVDNMHIRVTLNRVIKLIKAGYYQIWVFDGAPHDLKRETLDARAAAATAPVDGAATIGEIIGEVRMLFDAIGIQYVDAPGEAEAQCVEFVKGGKGDIIISTDTDIIMFGGKILRTWNGTEYHVDRILSTLDVTQDQLRDMCILMGTDYNPRVVGPATALKLIKSGKTLENAIAASMLLKKPPSAATLEKVKKAAVEIRTPNVIPAEMLTIIKPPSPTINAALDALGGIKMSRKMLMPFMNRLYEVGWIV